MAKLLTSGTSDQREAVRDREPVPVARVHESSESVVVVQPIGTQDVQARNRADMGPFPDPAQFSTARGSQQLQTKVDARRWGLACLDALAALDTDAADRALVAKLDAPLVRRVLDEATLPVTIRRLVLVVSDQPGQHVDDTAPFGRLVERWIAASRTLRHHVVAEITEPIVLRTTPHLVSAVAQQVQPGILRAAAGCDRVVVIHAGGTPAMISGTLLAAMGSGLPIRHIQVPYCQPLLEIDVPP